MIDFSDPAIRLLIALAALVLFISAGLIMVERHTRKLDDLVYAVHQDLATAEDEIAALKAVLARRSSTGRMVIRQEPKLDCDAQSYGRHAHVS